MVLQVTDAIVLHAFDYLETSRILRLVTREGGVQSVIARGARRSVKRFGSALDLFVSGIAELHIRQGRDLQQLSAFEVTNARPALSVDLDCFTSASMLCELALRCSAGEDHGDLFVALSAGLDAVATHTGTAARVQGLAVAWRVIATLGFAPSLTGCSSCQQPIAAGHAAMFSHVLGGVTCGVCEGQVRGGRRLPVDARLTLLAWIANEAVDLPSGASQRAHARLLREFVQHHVAEGVDLKAFPVWEARFA